MKQYIAFAFKAWTTNPTVLTQSALLALLLAEYNTLEVAPSTPKDDQDIETLLLYANLCM